MSKNTELYRNILHANGQSLFTKEMWKIAARIIYIRSWLLAKLRFLVASLNLWGVEIHNKIIISDWKKQFDFWFWVSTRCLRASSKYMYNYIWLVFKYCQIKIFTATFETSRGFWNKVNPFTTEPLAIFLLLETDNLGIIH